MQKKKLIDSALFQGHESKYLLNLDAAKNFRQMGNKIFYERIMASYSLYFEESIYLSNYKKEGRTISYGELAACKRNNKLSFKAGRGIVKLKLSDKSKWEMFVSCYDEEGDNEMQVRALWKHINERCGMEILSDKDIDKML